MAWQAPLGAAFQMLPGGAPLTFASAPSFHSPSNRGLAEVSRDRDAGWRCGKRCELPGGGGAEAGGQRQGWGSLCGGGQETGREGAGLEGPARRGGLLVVRSSDLFKRHPHM